MCMTNMRFIIAYRTVRRNYADILLTSSALVVWTSLESHLTC